MNVRLLQKAKQDLRIFPQKDFKFPQIIWKWDNISKIFEGVFGSELSEKMYEMIGYRNYIEKQ